MTNFLKGALVGAIALGGLAMTVTESSAMPVGNPALPAATESGQQPAIEKVYWRRYGYGWRRPYAWRYGYGWRRPWGYGYGWRRPWRYGYYGYRRPYGFYRW